MHFAKRTLNVQYYIVQQTSLEQVFLSFTRQQILPLLTVSPWERFYHSFCCCLVSQSEVQQERSETLRTHDRRVHSIAPV
ncbi:hypothetical protein BaRGS_00037195 [Batillaria attramentaria]|uniref:Uncharacterized protein n=1 Tax=Batillaria attramentaria TaxID=370345 RepID=A0ABD0J9Q5_9CAEN